MSGIKKKGFYKWNPITKEFELLAQSEPNIWLLTETFEDIEKKTNILYILSSDCTVNKKEYKKGFYTYDEELDDFVLQSGSSEVFTDISANDDLPATDINNMTIYRKAYYVYKHNNIKLESDLIGYKILDTENISISLTGITIDGTETLWADLNSTIINDLIENNRLKGASFADAGFFNYDETLYDIATNFERKNIYSLYHNPTKTADGYIQIGQNEGGIVEIDNKTIIKNTSNELQANAIIDLGNNDFPTTNILTKTYYRKNQTVSYVVEEVSKSFTMTKIFLYENGNWVSHSTITLTMEEYDHLSNDLKIDGTTYIVNGNGALITQWVYSTLQGKPVINGIVINGTLTLEDLDIYSREQVNELLEGKSGTEFVDYLPATMTKLTWYYSQHFADGTAVPDDKRAFYILDKNNTLQYMGTVGDVAQLEDEADLITPTDTDKLSKVNLTTNKVKSITFANLWNWIKEKALALAGGIMTGAIINGIEDIIINRVDNKSTSIYGGSAWGKGAQLQLRGKDRSDKAGYFQLYAGDGTNSAELVGKPNGELTWKGELIGGMKAYKKRYGVSGNGNTATISEKISNESTIFIVANVRRGVGLYMVVNAGSYGSTVKEIVPVTINSVEITVNSDSTISYKNNDSVYQWFDVIVVNDV